MPNRIIPKSDTGMAKTESAMVTPKTFPFLGLSLIPRTANSPTCAPRVKSPAKNSQMGVVKDSSTISLAPGTRSDARTNGTAAKTLVKEYMTGKIITVCCNVVDSIPHSGAVNDIFLTTDYAGRVGVSRSPQLDRRKVRWWRLM